MAKSGNYQFNVAKEIMAILDAEKQALLKKREVALDKAADYLVEKFRENTPRDTGITQSKWKRTEKYKGVRYIYNDALRTDPERGAVGGSSMPIINLLEFSKKGKPFIRATFEKEKSAIINIIMEELKK